MKRRILFVEPDPMLLDVYVKLLDAERDQWEVFQTRTASQALEWMGQAEFDVVVTDVDLPSISGDSWMNEVRARCANASRIIVSEISNQETVARCLNATHQFLAKPFEVGALKYALSRVGVLDAYLRSPQIKAIVSQLSRLPSLPSLYVQIMQELGSDDPSVEQVAAIIGQDPSMTARILQIVNSAAIGLARRISTPFEAVQYLGFGTVRSLVLAAHIFSSFSVRPGLKGFSINQLWRHAAGSGMLARMIMRLEHSAVADAEDANIAGMLHDIGKLILADAVPDRFQKACDLATQLAIPLHAAEMEVFGATHAGVGAYLFGLWGLPASIVEAIAFHHEPTRNDLRSFSPLTAVHVANVLEHELSQAKEPGRPTELDVMYLASLDLENRLDKWRAEAMRLSLQADENE
jgi:HD-like signal output (HDOD) protein/CheY-like chemotaxis protein